MFISSFFTFIIATFNCPKNKIQLGAIPVNKNTDAAVEVNGKKLDEGVARNDANANGTLSIIEGKVYEKL
jgi:hypothetical protein